MNILAVLRLNYCKAVFIVSLVLGYLLIPSSVFSDSPILAIIFLPIFATNVACTTQALITSIKSNAGHGIVSIFSSIFGLAALSACSASFFCGAAGIGILSVLIHSFALANFMADYGQIVVVISIFVQIATLKYMGCFRNCEIFKMLKKIVGK